MDVKPEDYANFRRDSVKENNLCKILRAENEEAVLQFVLRLTELDPRVGLAIARRVLRSPASAEAVLKLGIHLADASSMKWWLDVCIPKLGADKVIHILREHLESNLDAIDHALYWIPRTERPLSVEQHAKLQALADLCAVYKRKS